MLMIEFDTWRSQQRPDHQESDEDSFETFYEHNYFRKSTVEILKKLAYEIYELQVCMEGVLEELED